MKKFLIIACVMFIIAGNANAANDTHDFLQKYEGVLKDFVISHTKITEEKYESIKRLEYYMTADEMLELGIVDEII